jgi:hypothetical protein
VTSNCTALINEQGVAMAFAFSALQDAAGWSWLNENNDAVDWGFSGIQSQWVPERKPNSTTATYFTGYSYDGSPNSGWFAVLQGDQVAMQVLCRVKA